MSHMKELVIDIVDLYEDGVSVNDIAVMLSISQSLVNSVVDKHFGTEYNNESKYENIESMWDESYPSNEGINNVS